MYLEKIHQPSDLKALDYEQLDELAFEIREKIIEVVTATGGHIGPNLGVVELTIAIHRAFDSPRDAIIWDTGHQSYVHKLLTGRLKEFQNLRQPNGISGYPATEESEHDWVENSHASTSLSYAHGLATAFKRSNEEGELKRRVVAVVGDGSLTGGMAFEGLNNLGHSGNDVTIVLNDNGRSYAPTISKLGESLARLRINPNYLRQQERAESAIRALPLGKQIEKAVKATKTAIREIWEPPGFFENLGVKYTGPFEGHDIEKIENALKNASKIKGPIVVHVLTEKGRGYRPAENDSIKLMHDTSSTKPDSYTSAFSESLLKAAEEYPNLVAITAAMSDSTGLLGFHARYPDRFLDVGIAEQHAVTAAAGMAMGGLKPVVAIYSTFLTRAIDQLNLDVGLHRQSVVFCLDRSGITGDDGPSHHGILDMVLCSKIPGITIFAPSSFQDLQVMFDDALKIEGGPVVIRWPKTAARQVSAEDVGSGLEAREVLKSSEKKICILAVGKLVEASEEAAQLLIQNKINASVWDVRCIKPLDPKMIKAASEHNLVITVEDGLSIGGAGTGIKEAIAELDTKTKVCVMGIPDSYIPHGNADKILESIGLDGKGIAAQALKKLKI